MFLRKELSKTSNISDLIYKLSQKITIYITKICKFRIFTNKIDVNYLRNREIKGSMVKVLPGGVDNINLIPNKKYDACFIGRIHPQKGIPVLLKIWKKFIQKNPQAILAFICSGNKEEIVSLKNQIKKLGLQSNIKFFGFLDNQDKLQVLANSKMFLFPSSYESFGITVLEALSLKIPVVSFDLDAVKKSARHSIKYCLFLSFNVARSFFSGNMNVLFGSIKALIRYLRDFRNTDLCNEFLGYLEQFEKYPKMRMNVFVKLEKKNTKINIYDPTYTLENEFTTLLPYLVKSKIEFGLHSSAVTYQNQELIREQKIELEGKIGKKITSNRTHWLKFSWHNSWDILDTNDFICDETLMFNDRPGFRNSASLKWNPWSQKESKTLNILAIPSILMDSHLYLYGRYDDKKRKEVIKRYFEINSKYGGNASVVWHPHTLSLAYGWNSGFNEVLKNLGNIKQ